MRKYTLIITLLVVFILSGNTRAQSVSMDFTRTDCDGTEHHLYSELDAGKVVILDFVMLGCSSCIIGSNGLNKIYNNFEGTNPGRVRFYAFGYDDNYTCTQLRAWVTDNHFNSLMFEDGAQQTGYYGGMGMPTIVVTATNTHAVLYRKLGYEPSDDDAIIAAINTGLQYSPQGTPEQAEPGVMLYPSVFTDHFTLKLPRPVNGWITLYDLTGQQVLKAVIDNTAELRIDGSLVKAGLYFATIFAESGTLGSYKLIKR